MTQDYVLRHRQTDEAYRRAVGAIIGEAGFRFSECGSALQFAIEHSQSVEVRSTRMFGRNAMWLIVEGQDSSYELGYDAHLWLAVRGYYGTEVVIWDRVQTEPASAGRFNAELSVWRSMMGQRTELSET